MNWGNALELASHIRHPVTVTAYALVLACFCFWLVHRAKKPRLAWLLASALVVLGLAPLIASTFLQTRGVYRVRVVVKSHDQQLVRDAVVTSSAGGEVKSADGSWEVEVPPQILPANHKVTLYASRRQPYESGNSIVELGDDFYPTVEITLHWSPAPIRGTVRDESGRPVANARISVSGYHDAVTSDEAGNFELSAHSPEGKPVSIHAEKGDLMASRTVLAGSSIDLVLRRSQ